MHKLIGLLAIALFFTPQPVWAAAEPVRTEGGMVVSANDIGSKVGADILKAGGNAMDATIATAFAMAVTHPTAGNIGGGGFLLFRAANGAADSYDFREKAPAKATADMFLTDGKYDPTKHHRGYLSVGVPGTVAGLHLAWKEHGSLKWEQLVEPAIKLARDGFPVSIDLASSLAGALKGMQPYPASVAQFSKNGAPYKAGEILKQPDLARTLERIAANGPAGFYEGETAELIEKEMASHGGLITRKDLKAYQAKSRKPVRGTYRGYEILSVPPPSSGGIGIIESLNLLEGYDLRAAGYGSAQSIHLIAEAMRRSFADRAQFIGDPDFNPKMPLETLLSKDHGSALRRTIDPIRASVSSPTNFTWPIESTETTHFSVVDSQRNAVSITYTLEWGYGSSIVVPGAGFLLNNEMGDFNAGTGLTTESGLIGTKPNLALPGKRMLSSMSPTILAKDGQLFMVTGSPGGRTIINTTLLTILYAVDFEMNAQEVVDAGRFHHQWLPDVIRYEDQQISPDTLALLKAKGHQLKPISQQGSAQIIINEVATHTLAGGVDRRDADAFAATTQ